MSDSFEMRVQDTISWAYLRSATPQSVYDWLEDAAPKERGQDGPSEELLERLLNREEPLVRLGIARFSNSHDILGRVYQEGDVPIQCAVLANQAFAKDFIRSEDRSAFLSSGAEEKFLGDSDRCLLESYLSNPAIDLDVLTAIFERGGIAGGLEDERWKLALLYAGQNKALHTEYEYDRFGGPFEGLMSALHSRPVQAAWALLDSMPVTEEWARRLSHLLFSMYYELPRSWSPALDGDSSEIPVSLELANERFFADILDRWKDEEEGEWSAFRDLRTLIASKAPYFYRSVMEFLREHPDEAVRKGYYENFRPIAAAEVESAFERDGEVFLRSAITNRHFFERGRKPAARALYRLIMGTERGDSASADSTRWLYVGVGEDLAKSQPEKYEFNEDELSREPSEEAQHRPTRMGFSHLARTMSQLLLLTSDSGERNRSVANDFVESVESIEAEYREGFESLTQAIGERFNRLEAQVVEIRNRAAFLVVIVFVTAALVFLLRD